MENKYAEGSTVFAIENPGLRLTVRRYIKSTYYCTDQSDPAHKDRVYFERELQDYEGAAAPSPAH